MPKYLIGDQILRRKNLYLPCAIGARFETLTDEEQVAIFKKCWWADNITASEWPVVLGDVRNPSAKSRLKKKAVGWWMALSRLSILAPDIYNDSVKEASELYLELIEENIPIFGDRS